MHKICFIIASMKTGGAERTVSIISNYLSENDFDVSIAVYDKSEPFYKIGNNIKYIPLDILGNNKKNRYSMALDRIKILRSLFKKENFDVVICMNNKILSTSLIASVGLKVKVIGSERSNPFQTSKNPLSACVKKITAFFTDGYIFQTKGSSEFYLKKTRKNSAVIANSVEKTEFLRDESMIDNVVFSVGRLVPSKNHETLIKAFEIVKKSKPDLKLFFYGDGILKDDYIKLCKDLNIIDNVCFMGNSKNIKQEIKNHKLFVLTSIYEGMPNVLLEAMSIGIPSISSRCKFGPEEIIDNRRNGLLFEVGDYEKLAKLMLEILDNKELYRKISENSVKVNDTYSVESIGAKWSEYLSGILKKV